ncbi:MAG: RNA polymerase sigma factor [Cyclobacteriaceae bacterium]|nr:RNA polymerase sigma factor [Cyclobacteriaceae bacterium]
MFKVKDIINGCKKGDRKCQKELYDHYAPFMLSVSRRYTKSIGEAEDVVQDSFIKIFKSLDTFRGDTNLDFWIRRIVINTALNSQRSKLYLFPMVDVEDVKLYTDEKFTLKDFHLEDLYKMIQELPTGCQVIFNLYAVEGYSHKEVAEMLEISEGTSKSQYSRAKLLLKEKIEKEKKINYEFIASR